MNFLAHLYLSGGIPEIMVGNFIGDFVKGRNLLEQFRPGIAKGIELHRMIDEFTDGHSIVMESKKRLRPKYRHYAAVIVDMYYDHFLARNWNDYHPELLPDFAEKSYTIMEQHWPILPEGVRYILPYMIKSNWLVNYATIEGIQRALTGMSRRTKFVSGMNEATAELLAYYNDFESEFRLFFPELRGFAGMIIQGPSG